MQPAAAAIRDDGEAVRCTMCATPVLDIKLLPGGLKVFGGRLMWSNMGQDLNPHSYGNGFKQEAVPL